MSSGLKYGLFLGLLMVALGECPPQPIRSIALWAALSLQAAVGLWITWRRFRLRWFTFGGAVAFLVSLAMIPVSARGLNLATIATELPLLVVGAIWLCVLFVPLSVGLESLRNSPEWRAWSNRVERATLWDMITFRHVPDVRPLRPRCY